MNIRRIASLTALLSFVLMLLTSIVLYIVPAGRVAYWADWKLLGLSKGQWGELHINLGVLFLLSIFLHIYYNWKPITAYLKDKMGRVSFLTANFGVALVLTFVFGLGTYFTVPPFSTITDFSDSIKEKAATKYGEPPYGHAELSPLKNFARRMQFDLESAIATLREAEIKVDSGEQTVLAIAKANKLSPQQLFLVIKEAAEATNSQGPAAETVSLPETHPPGFGRRTLTDLSQEYGLSLPRVQAALAAQGIAADQDMAIRDIAKAANVSSEDILLILQEVAADRGSLL